MWFKKEQPKVANLASKAHEHRYGKWLVTKVPDRKRTVTGLFNGKSAETNTQVIPGGSEGIRLCDSCGWEETRHWPEFSPQAICKLYNDRAEEV